MINFRTDCTPILLLIIIAFSKAYIVIFCICQAPILIQVILAIVTLEKIYLHTSLLFFFHINIGLFGSFLFHELIHGFFISLFLRNSHSIIIEYNFIRFSIIPTEVLLGWKIVVIAFTPSFILFNIGFMLYLFVPHTYIYIWYFLHLLFLLPFFGDGKSCILGLLHWHDLI